MSETAELGLYFKLKAIGESEVLKAFGELTSGLDTMASACSRLGGPFKEFGGLLRQVTGGIYLMVGIFNTAQAAIKLLSFVTWTQVTALWAQVKAQLAVLLSNPFTMALAAVCVAAIGVMIGSLIALESQTRRTSAAMKEMGEITVTHSVLPDMVYWIKELRREASTPIIIDVRTRGDLSLARRGLF